MRQLFKAQLKSRTNPIFLNYGNKLQRFAFLEGGLQSQNNTNLKLNFKQKYIDNWTAHIAKRQQSLRDILDYDFTQDDLHKIQAKEFSTISSPISKFNSRQRWIKNQPILYQLSENYVQLQNHLYQNLTRQNLSQTILLLTANNCLDIRIWQRVISFISLYYKEQSLPQRLNSITAISQYLKKFMYSYQANKKNAFKFMYPESYIRDLVDFRCLFRGVQCQKDFILKDDSLKDEIAKVLLLQNLIYLIMKASKKADMNIYEVRDYFQKRTQQMIHLASRYHLTPHHQKILYNIYFIYSFLNYTNDQFYSKIQESYYEHFRRQMLVSAKDNNSVKEQQLLVSNKSKQVSKILSIWKLNRRADLRLYGEVIKPFLKFIVSNRYQTVYYSVLGINLLMAGVKDHEIINQMVRICDQNKVPQDQYHHMLKHYLNIVNGNDSYHSQFYKCGTDQNAQILNHLSEKKIPLFSSCLHQPQVSDRRYKKMISFEYHKTQRLWFQILNKIFSSKYKTFQNVKICTYEIDFLILTQDGMIAVQIQGGHYNKKKLNRDSQRQSSSQLKSTGKKYMRECILNGYNIKTFKIHCEQKMPTYVMQFQNVQIGCSYLKERMRKQLGTNI